MAGLVRLKALMVLTLTAAGAAAAPSVYPTGTTVYDPAKTWNGFTVLTLLRGQSIVVIDMNGRVVKQWDGFNNSAGGPARLLPGGIVMGANGARPQHQESLELVQQDFAGKVTWRLAQNEEIETVGEGKAPSLRQHHDWQREDFPAGYYSPGIAPAATGSNTLVLTHTNYLRKAVTDLPLEDDRLLEFTADGKISWQWTASDHIDEFGFDAAARAAIRAGAGANSGPGARSAFDWAHLNSATYVGPNKWFDAGDARFAPNNVIISSRQASVIAIVARDGRVVWRLGPDFSQTKETRELRQIIGQHHVHLIPKGLPGAGNLMIFDNGGSSGYGFFNPIAPNGLGAFARASSRVLEIDPITLKLLWSYAPPSGFFSTNISGAQRLPDGNTLITEGAGSRVFEVTNDGKIVWEYMNPPYMGSGSPVYRAYRVPYEWMPQVKPPKEVAVTPLAPELFKVPAGK